MPPFGDITNTKFFDSYEDIMEYKARKDISYEDIFNTEYKVSNFYQRIKEAMNPYNQDPNRTNPRLLTDLQRNGKDNTFVRIRFYDLEQLMHYYESMDNELREYSTDLALRSEPTIINMPEGLEKEEYIKNNPQALF